MNKNKKLVSIDISKINKSLQKILEESKINNLGLLISLNGQAKTKAKNKAKKDLNIILSQYFLAEHNTYITTEQLYHTLSLDLGIEPYIIRQKIVNNKLRPKDIKSDHLKNIIGDESQAIKYKKLINHNSNVKFLYQDKHKVRKLVKQELINYENEK